MSNERRHLPIEYYKAGQWVSGKMGTGYIDFIKKVYPKSARTYDEIGFRDKDDDEQYHAYEIAAIKPILRRPTSMSVEEINIVRSLMRFENINFGQENEWLETPESIDWLDTKGFDRPRFINGVEIESLIEAGLAIDARKFET